MSGYGVRFPRRLSATAILFFLTSAAFMSPAMAADAGSPIPNLAGPWGRDTLFFEPPASGPGPVSRAARNADGASVKLDRCCTPSRGRWFGDYTSPILKPEAAAAVRKYGDLSVAGIVPPDLHNSCWSEPPPFVLGTHFAVQILQQKDEVTLLYLINTVRHVYLNTQHPANLTPSHLGHSVGWYEGDTLVIDTVGIKVTPLSSIDLLGTPHSKALHVVERYRVIDVAAAVEAQEKAGTAPVPGFLPYGRADIDPDKTRKGLQVEFTVEDDGVFTMPWKGRVTYRGLLNGDWPEAVCAENPTFFSNTTAPIPTADMPDF
jgi:hypothetical protein